MELVRIDPKVKPTIDDLKPKDRINGYPLHVPRWYTRFFEIMPGLLSWGFILLPVIAALLKLPEIIIYYIAFFTAFWIYRGIRYTYGILTGYRRFKRDLERDFIKEIAENPEVKDDLKYVLIYPIVNEGLETLDPALKAWVDQDMGASKISLVFALEERFSQQSLPNIEKLVEKYGDKFRECMLAIHPNDIEGEVMGVKGSNINWATRNFVKVIQARGEQMSDYLLITCDNDLRGHPKFLSAITAKYWESEDRNNRFYASAVHTFNNNLWRVPVFVRVFSVSLTLAVMQEWVMAKSRRDSWSAYIINLETVDKVGYWDPMVGIDDTFFFWNAQVRLNGKFTGEEVYIPTYNDAVENENRVKTYKAFYKQQLRWGWGIIVFPIFFAGIYQNKAIHIADKVRLSLVMYYQQLMNLTLVYGITFYIPLLSLFSSEFRLSAASYNLSVLMSTVLTALLSLNIPIYYVRSKFSPPPREWSLFRRFLDLFEIFLITINMLTFNFIPYVHAHSEMMANKFRKKYYATEKVVK